MPVQFPEFSGSIFGEESNIFTNSFGQKVRIEVQEDSSATSKHLATVLCGNESAARLLADLIHSDIVLEKEEARALEDQLDFELPLNELAIWIDPIGKRGMSEDSRSTTPVFFFYRDILQLHLCLLLFGCFQNVSQKLKKLLNIILH